jgi:hypothetical protein
MTNSNLGLVTSDAIITLSLQQDWPGLAWGFWPLPCHGACAENNSVRIS